MTGTELRVVPRPRQVEEQAGSVQFEPPFVLATTDADAAPALSLLETLVERETNEPTVEAGDPDVRLILENRPSAGFDGPEGYVLATDDDAVTIRSGTVDGLRHGCQTFVGGLVRDGGWSFPACEIRDRPETDWRGFMLDPARGFLSVDRVKRRIDQAARAKLNRLHLHLADDEGYALESERFPELNRDPDGTERPAYSPEDVAELVEYADRRGIDVVPEIDLPTHAGHVLDRYPDLQCTVEDGEASEHTLCLGSASTVEFVEALLAEVVDLFPFEVVHVGGDEWEMIGHSWEECVDCRERMAEDGSETVTGHFYAFVRHLREFLDERDRRLMLWNDQIDVAETPELPRDVLVQFWRVAGPGRGPVEGCSMERFLEEGFDVVNSYVYAAYVNGWVSEDYLHGWSPRRRPAVPDGREDQVVGGELLAWEPSDEESREYFERALPSAIPIFADRLWNPSPIEDRPAFRRALTRHALGPHAPAEFDVYRELGGTILPTAYRTTGPGKPAHVDGSFGDRTLDEAKAAYEDAVETLSGLRESGEAVYPKTASVYEESLTWLLEVIDRERRGVIDRP